ncbi:vWA domain-containing protein [Aquisphaera insulae]|uniref:vWA domain-containing protein n=1 Tax=Aquisphaera insulae TaxID=2712864 RepID=UPI0013EDE9B7|nr:VWA domain-containing protein [Aquisphaera insulae]
MDFARPLWLWLLLVPIPIGLLLRREGRARARAWISLVQRGRPPGLWSWSVVLAMVLLVIALARPRFGSPIGPSPPPGHDVVLLVDVSRSMAAEDAVPSRLGVAVESAGTLVAALAAEPASRAAVVAFAGRGVLRYPMTENLGAVTDVLGRLRPGSVQPGSSDLGAGLRAAVDAFGKDEHLDGRSIVVFSDGEDHVGRWPEAVASLVGSGVVVHTVAIGDADLGHPVPGGESGAPLRFEGKPVESRRVDEPLVAIAKETGGAAVPLGLASMDMSSLYRERIAPAALARRRATHPPEREERFPFFLATAMGLVLSASWPPGRVGPLRWAWRRLAGAVLIATLVVTGLGAGEAPGRLARDRVATGERSYRAGRFDAALSDFEAAIGLAPREAVPRFDAAAALFQLRRFPEASGRYQEARELADERLRVKIDFALGNTALALGDLTGAVESYDRCVSSVVRGPGLDGVRADAAENRRFALEQAPPSVSATSDQDEPSDPPRGSGRRPPNRPNGEDEADGDDPGAGKSGPDGQDPGRQGEQPGRAPNRRRRVGGAGGSSKDASARAGETPDDVLDQAVDEIRNALDHRLPDEAPAVEAAENRKDW